MRYLCPVSDFTHDRLTTHLSAPEARLTGILARPKRIAFACIVVLTAFGWLALALMTANFQPGWQALCQPIPGAGWGELAIAAPMWAAMTLVMMLPTAGPMIVTYAEIADTAARKGEPVVSPLVLTAGYVGVWLGFAVAATALQAALTRLALLDSAMASASPLFSGAVFIGAGAYQFTALKHACVTRCQRPFPFFFANWSSEPRGIFRLGLRQGLYCLGCCWATMLAMFAVGTMNVVWMVAFALVMTLEKMTVTTRFSHAVGVAFVAIGVAFIAVAVAAH